MEVKEYQFLQDLKQAIRSIEEKVDLILSVLQTPKASEPSVIEHEILWLNN